MERKVLWFEKYAKIMKLYPSSRVKGTWIQRIAYNDKNHTYVLEEVDSVERGGGASKEVWSAEDSKPEQNRS